MKTIKLYEQWIQEEADSSSKPYKIEVTPSEGAPFEIEASSKPDLNTSLMTVFDIKSSTNSGIKAGSTLMMSPRADKEGDFDLIVTTNPNDPAASTIFTGKAKVTDVLLTAKAAVTG